MVCAIVTLVTVTAFVPPRDPPLFEEFPGGWFVEGTFGFVIAFAVSDSRIEFRGAQGTTIVDIEGMTVDEAMAAGADGSGKSQPTLPGGPTKQLCQCSAAATITCAQVELTSYRCCAGTTFCSCMRSLSSSGCVLGIKAPCVTATIPNAS